MIIFDLDSTLADCEHRRHYVDPEKFGLEWWSGEMAEDTGNWTRNGVGVKWKPDWKKFHEECDKDTPIFGTLQIFDSLCYSCLDNHEIMIWSGRCESVREKTISWLKKHSVEFIGTELKMRPEGDYTPDDDLKEMWLDEAIKEGRSIDYVFDDRPKVIRMYRRRGVFVFDVNQSGKEF